MYQVDEQPETIHLYVVREHRPRPSVLPLLLSVVALSVLVAFCVSTPSQQPVIRTTIRVPAVLLPAKAFTAQVPIIPTGIQTYPATIAHGTLTITNGSVIAQVIPAGFRVQNVATDMAVYVPPGSANGYGYASVSAHALTSGAHGNIPAYAINQVEGSSVYIRNLSAFYGGRDGYSVNFITPHDKNVALVKSRNLLTASVTGLHYPCSEQVSGAVTVTWRCQFVTYSVPSYMHVDKVQLIRTNLLLSVWFIARPKHIWVK